MKKKLLIIGINSFLGSNFYKYIHKDNNYHIFGTVNKNTFRIDNFSNKYRNNTFKIDLTKKNNKFTNLLKKINPDYIINFSGESYSFVSKNKKLNILIIKNITNSLKKSKICINHFYNIGSCEEYYGSKVQLKENSRLFNYSSYGNYKINIHKYLLKASKKNKFNYTNLRTFNILGYDRHKKNIVTFLKSNLNNKKLKLNNINSIRDFMWLDDYLFSIKSILNYNKKKYQAINIGTGKGTSIQKIINYISRKKQLNLDNKINNRKIKTEIYNIKIANNSRLNNISKKNNYLSIYKIIDKLI